jgi:hypothetical protein
MRMANGSYFWELPVMFAAITRTTEFVETRMFRCADSVRETNMHSNPLRKKARGHCQNRERTITSIVAEYRAKAASRNRVSILPPTLLVNDSSRDDSAGCWRRDHASMP